jgi:hypothetical protein
VEKPLRTVFARGSSKKGEIRTFAQFAIALGKPMKKSEKKQNQIEGQIAFLLRAL